MSFSAKYLIPVFLFLVSCGDSVTKREFCNDDGQQVVQEWYNDKQIKSNITYLDRGSVPRVRPVSIWRLDRVDLLIIVHLL